MATSILSRSRIVKHPTLRRLASFALIPVFFSGSLQPPSLAAALPSHHLAGRSTTITVYDPQEVGHWDLPPDCAEDIRFASLRTYVGGTGRRMLAVTVTVYHLYGGTRRVGELQASLRCERSGVLRTGTSS